MDVAYMQDNRGYNYQLQYWLVVTDVYLRYVWVKLMRNKMVENVASKFREILNHEKVVPEHIQTDEGSEFSLIHNIISLIKELKWRLLHQKVMVRCVITVTDNKTYVKAIQPIIERYNMVSHRALGQLTPHEVYPDNEIPHFLIFPN